jgi:SEC-C motif-containing protein
MRSRYSAYALGKVDYILSTTHPENPQYGQQWKDSVFEFCRDTRFIKLDILASAETTVKFAAHLIQRGKSFVLEEESLFQKENGKWLYLKALSSEAKSPDGKS